MSSDAYKICALIDFDDEVGVYIDTNAREDSQKYAGILLFTSLTIRILGLTKTKVFKFRLLKALLEAEEGMENLLRELLSEYRHEYHLSDVVVHNEADGSTKKGFIFNVDINAKGHRPHLKARGFGILGKNIESSSLIAVLLVFFFLSKEYAHDKEFILKLNKSAHSLGRIGASEIHLNPFNALSIAEEVANESYQVYGA